MNAADNRDRALPFRGVVLAEIIDLALQRLASFDGGLHTLTDQLHPHDCATAFPFAWRDMAITASV